MNSTSEVPKTGNIMPAKSDEESITAENGPNASQGSNTEDVIEIQSNVMALDGDLRREFETCVIAVLKARKRAREAIEEYGIFSFQQQLVRHTKIYFSASRRLRPGPGRFVSIK